MVDLGEATNRKQQSHLMKNRKLTVIYVENDPFFRSLIGNLLRNMNQQPMSITLIRGSLPLLSLGIFRQMSH